jgi:hypothetical protein
MKTANRNKFNSTTMEIRPKGKGALDDKFNLKKKVQIRQSKLELLCDKGIWDRF